MTPDARNEESTRAWWNPRNWPAGIWALVIGFLLLMLPFGIRTLILAGIPAMPEPFDVDEFAKWDVPAEEDAFTEYRQATELRLQIAADLRSRSVLDPNVDAILEKGWAEADEPIKEWLDLHREVLTVWRRGADKQRGRDLSRPN